MLTDTAEYRESVTVTNCTCCTPPAVRTVTTADRTLDICAARSDQPAAIRAWIRGMITQARARGFADPTIGVMVERGLAEFLAAFEAAAGDVEHVAFSVESGEPMPMTFAQQFVVVLSRFPDASNPTWYEGAAQRAAEVAREILAEGGA